MREHSANTEKSLRSLTRGTELELRDMSTFFSGLALGTAFILTAKREGKFISRRSGFSFPDWVLSVFYDSILANYVASLDVFPFPIK